ncbi:lactosylceramide 4-alpha-galactosyltransferase [Rhagoletis pomonella]|uniref:lactosylceramide 4-alpha-galactosyltransferase n=1 Tax=Rhagoletis pomonella TaxID=28610 RepID=UPI001785B25A|nr:lactosylceramide 4-alpha-galactosyltransferase [Rhagoletis pomonella]
MLQELCISYHRISTKFLRQQMKLIMSKPRLKWMMLMLLSLIAFSWCLFYSSNMNRVDVRYCYMNTFTTVPSISSPTHNKPADGPHLLEDVMLVEPKPNASGRSIIFHETSCPHEKLRSSVKYMGNAPLNMMELTTREACAIESAALHNPSFSVFVLFASPAYRDYNNTPPVIEAILSYPNVHLRNLNLWTYAAGTPMYQWLKDGKLFSSSYVLSHLSDFLRYLTLWRWGGTYLDMDVVVLRSLEKLPPNYTGAESSTFLAAGVMNFSPDGFGHEIAEKCLLDFLLNFDGGDWGNNGPGVITRVMNDVCKTSNIELMMEPKRCMGFHVMPREVFYAIPWKKWEYFFEAQYLTETLDLLQHSYVAHVWNKHSKQRRIKVGANAAYGILAERHCPKVYAAAGEYF